jgi:hypothetical protein
MEADFWLEPAPTIGRRTIICMLLIAALAIVWHLLGQRARWPTRPTLKEHWRCRRLV